MNQLERVARAIVDAIDGDTDEWRMWAIEAQAAIDAIDAMQKWQPIETAPHNEAVLLYCPYRHESNPERIEIGEATRGARNSFRGMSTYSAHAWATHWMPLPKLPGPPK